MQVLVGTGRVAEPGIVGDVNEPSGTLPFIGNPSGKDDLVADEREERGRPCRFDKGRLTGPGLEAVHTMREHTKSHSHQGLMKWNVLTERNKVSLVVDRLYRSILAYNEKAVERVLEVITPINRKYCLRALRT